MRWRLSSLFLIVALSACTFQVDVIETPLPGATVIVESATSTPLPPPDHSATPPPFPTDIPAATEQIIVSTFPPPDVLPIVFQANGTSQIVVGSVAAGSSQTYSLRASQGQIMSVSILPENAEQQNSFQFEIKGSDGAVLCPANDRDCPFWRGTLPSTQEYFIRVIPQAAGGAFKLRIAINPPGKAYQYFEYADPLGRYVLSYSDEFAPTHYTAAQASKFKPEIALEYIDTPQYVPTNLVEAYFLIGSSTDPQAVSTCTQPASLGGPESVTGDVKINNILFTKSQGSGVAAGSIYEQIFFRTVKNATCYEVTYFIHFANIGNYAGDVNVKEFDHDALIQKLDELLSTVVIK